jgi:hypothetical protein
MQFSRGEARTRLSQPGSKLGVDGDGSTEDLSGISVCVVASHYKPESTTGSAPYDSMLVETLLAVGAEVDVGHRNPSLPAVEGAGPPIQSRTVLAAVGRILANHRTAPIFRDHGPGGLPTRGDNST